MTATNFSYVQIGAKDYKALADFYVKAIGFQYCDDQSWLFGKEGICIQAPGFSEGTGPIFGFVPATEGVVSKINDNGFAHTCFETNDVYAAISQFLKCGGSVHSTMSNPKRHPCVYCKDPEGNVVEFHIPFPSQKSIGAYAHTAGCLLGLNREKSLRNGNPDGAIKFIHVNIICADWEQLCDFYQNVFDCTRIGNIKNHQGNYKAQVIGVPDVHVVGQHILLPGFAPDYPTLEIFTYSVPGRTAPCNEQAIGINCIGFACDSIDHTAQSIVNAGGTINQNTEQYILAGDLQNGRILLRQKN